VEYLQEQDGLSCCAFSVLRMMKNITHLVLVDILLRMLNNLTNLVLVDIAMRMVNNLQHSQ
jgi:hypothetical protein